MSGGSYDYAYHHVDRFADDLGHNLRHPPEWEGDWEVYDRAQKRHLSPEESAPIIAKARELREWFVGHLELVARAMHDIEWIDSGDYGPGDEIEALEKVRAHLEKVIE